MYLKHKNLTNQIIKTLYDVYNELGHGFLENVYQNTLYLELKNRGIYVEAQKQIKVYYKNTQVGVYYADLIIDEVIILELKAAEVIVKEFEFQLLNYLKPTEIEVSLLLNFGVKPEFKRKIFTIKKKLESSLE
ncbi:GxxExxY protein [Brumimicrobium oceani]|uniref:GxxExxY protein n=1 Tax=Brumimicrobium oceani TaxID=2100725 RepID=A0A2U2XGT1_9FLAO|nr:GxxExxY protein [Brumimicrobium oceani]PWH87006.1 GxxExxY protein [Brumimicrobium oceani]